MLKENFLLEDEEKWIVLMKQAKDLGLAIDDVKQFISKNKPVSK